MNKDLTTGKPDTVLWKFCLPLFGSIVFQQLYNLADSFVAGKFINEKALAAVGNSYEITLIFIAFAFGCNIGCSVIVSQFFGAKKYTDMKSAIYTALISSGIICIILMFLGLFFSRYLLTIINTPENIMYGSKLYLDIYIWGLPFLFFYNISTGIFSALGDSKTPFIFLAISSCANILVDICFVKILNMGISGVAWATFICQGASCILAISFVLKRIWSIKTKDKPALFSIIMFKKLSSIAVPSILQQSFISVGNIVIQSVINSFGSGAIAGYSAAVKLNNLVITSYTTIGNGISNFTAQNIGAGKLNRIKEGFKAGIKMIWIITVPVVLIYLTACRPMVHFFMNNPSTAAINTGTVFLRIVAPFYFLISVKLIADGVLRGAGLMKYFMISTFTDLVLRVIIAIFLSKFLGTTGIWCAWPMGWSISTFLSVYFYKKGPWIATAKNNII